MSTAVVQVYVVHTNAEKLDYRSISGSATSMLYILAFLEMSCVYEDKEHLSSFLPFNSDYLYIEYLL